MAALAVLNSASEVTTIWRYTNVYIIIIISKVSIKHDISDCRQAIIMKFGMHKPC